MPSLRSAIQTNLDAAVAVASALQVNLEQVQTSLAAANTQVDALRNNLSNAEGTFLEWMDLDVDAVKQKAEALVAELAKYPTA